MESIMKLQLSIEKSGWIEIAMRQMQGNLQKKSDCFTPQVDEVESKVFVSLFVPRRTFDFELDGFKTEQQYIFGENR